MTIERITREEFEAVPKPRSKGSPSPEVAALRAMNVGEGIKFPCRWKHDTRNRCASHSAIRGIKQSPLSPVSLGWKLTIRCHQGTVYVLRIA